MARQSCRAAVPPFLLTRPAAQSDRFAEQLRFRFGQEISVVCSPLIAPRYLTPPLPDRSVTGLIFTSETGVAAFRRLTAHQPLVAWCVGDRTADAARAAGYEARSAGGDATDLSAAIVASGESGPWLHARGRDTTNGLTDALRSAGAEIIDLIVYAQQSQPLSAQAADMLGGEIPVIAPLFSSRTAALLAGSPYVSDRISPLWIAALSAGVLQSASVVRPERSVTASRPDAVAMLDAIETFVSVAPQP